MAQWQDQLGRNWTPAVKFNLPDLDVFTIDANATTPTAVGQPSFAHVGTILFNMVVSPTDPDKSYVARLFAKGLDAMLKKVGEEATETVMAAKDGDPQKVVYEVADLWFHSMIVLAAFDLKPADVLAELARREGLSGLEEFALRRVQQREQQEDPR